MGFTRVNWGMFFEILLRVTVCLLEALLFIAFESLPTWAQIPDGILFRRLTRVSNFEFALHNNGLLYGDTPYGREGAVYPPPIAHWPRGSDHMVTFGGQSGLIVLAKKGSRFLTSDASFIKDPHRSHGQFNQTVPGRMGDPRAGYDPVFNGVGWRYVDDIDYILYSSLDYDSTGVDTSGSNFNDWPIRWVNGEREYVGEPLQRHLLSPAYCSDEDMFCVYKDTDTRADQLYAGPNGPSIPIGVEVHNTVFTWGSGPGKDIVLFQYDVFNKSRGQLDSCYLLFGYSLRLYGMGYFPWGLRRELRIFQQERWRNLAYMRSTNPSEWQSGWNATPIPPTLGYVVLNSPNGYGGLPVGMIRVEPITKAIQYRLPLPDTSLYWISESGNDSIYYRTMSLLQSVGLGDSILDGPVVLTGPFPMSAGQKVTATFGLMFSDSLPHLLLMDDFIKRVYNSGFQRPIPPPPPRLTARGINRGVLLSWDRSAESATDPMIPENLGQPFRGYRLLRATAERGPYVDIGRWTSDSGLVHEHLDRGTDIEGLKNNVRYYYQLLSFDEGAKKLKLDPMYSKPVSGVNAVSVVPTTEPSNATSSGSEGTVANGSLGDVSLPSIVPTNATNFNNLISGRQLSASITTVTDGIKYIIPLTVKDTLAGRVHNAIIDPQLNIHGTPQTAGIKEATSIIKDIFGIGAANLEVHYRFEQLQDSFHIVSAVQSATGTDVPIIINDSLSVTGLQQITPYSTARREVRIEFSPGGLDTLAGLFGIILPYLNVRLVDVVTSNEYVHGVDWRMAASVVRSIGGGPSAGRVQSRYYLSGAVPNGTLYDAGHLLTFYNSAIAFDYTDHGRGSGRPTPQFEWASPHRRGTRDFSAGDVALLTWEGGVRAVFPQNAVVTIIGAPPGRTEVTDAMMDGIRIVPNPYLVHHEAQRGDPRIYFNYLPEECEIRIYTVALDLVKTMWHSGGSREEWNLQTEGGQWVASQLLIAYIEAPNGVKTTKKFAVVVGR
jgi:hypothetical protein